jgi:hypothetical protein
MNAFFLLEKNRTDQLSSSSREYRRRTKAIFLFEYPHCFFLLLSSCCFFVAQKKRERERRNFIAHNKQTNEEK